MYSFVLLKIKFSAKDLSNCKHLNIFNICFRPLHKKYITLFIVWLQVGI